MSYLGKLSLCTTKEEVEHLLDENPAQGFITSRYVYEYTKKPEICLFVNQIYQSRGKLDNIINGYAYFLRTAQLDFARTFTTFIEINDFFKALVDRRMYGNLLYEIARTGYMDVIHFLFELGLDVNCIDRNNETMLFEACSTKNIELIDLLIDKGVNVNHMSKGNETAIFNAVRSDEVQVVDKLIIQGVNLNPGKNLVSLTPLDYAIYRGNFQIVRRLIDMRVIPKKKHLFRAYLSLLNEGIKGKYGDGDIDNAKKMVMTILETGLEDITNNEILEYARTTGKSPEDLVYSSWLLETFQR